MTGINLFILSSQQVEIDKFPYEKIFSEFEISTIDKRKKYSAKQEYLASRYIIKKLISTLINCEFTQIETKFNQKHSRLEALYNNNIREWFRGSEDIFYMMPGMRYLLATSMIFFGESIFGLLIIISLTPLVIRSLLQRIFNKKWELIMLSCFFIIPIFEAFSFFQIYLAKYTIEGFGAGIAIVSLISAFSLLWKEDNNTYTNIDLLKAGLCLAIAISLRPNFLPAIIILLSGLSLNFAYTNNLTKVIPLSIGFSPILLVTYHNFFFGNKFIPITNSATIGNNMRNSPEKWLECFNLVPNACNDIYNHIRIWVSYTEPWYIFIIGCFLFIIFSKKLSFKN